MSEKYSITLSKIIDKFGLKVLHLPSEAASIDIANPEVNRPGLALAGFFENF